MSLGSTNFINHSLHDVLKERPVVCLALSIESPLLSHHSCEESLPALCGYHLSPPPPPSQPIANSHLKCSPGWILYKSACYRLEPPPNALQTWHDAELTCLKSGAHLVSIGDEAEGNFVRSLFPEKDRPVWVGLKLIREWLIVAGVALL